MEKASEATAQRAAANAVQRRREAFVDLVHAHADWLHRYLAGLMGSLHDAEDCAQEVFLRAWCALPRYAPKDRAEERALLRTIAMRTAFNAMRARRAKKRTAPPADTPPAAWALHAEMNADRETAQTVLAALAELPHIYREVLVLRYFEDLSVAEIAALLDLGESAVKMRLARARKAMRSVLDDARRTSGSVAPTPDETTREEDDDGAA